MLVPAGLMGPISNWVVQEVCRQAVRWEELDLRIGFNLPPAPWQPSVLQRVLTTLSRLAQLSVTTLKIDRSFIRELTRSRRSRELVSTIVQLARNLRMEPLAEGIETERQRDLLLERGCSLGQGFLFSPAVRPERIEELLDGLPGSPAEAGLAG